MAVIGLDAHQDVNRGHDESLNDQRMFDDLRATPSAGRPAPVSVGIGKRTSQQWPTGPCVTANPSQLANGNRTLGPRYASLTHTPHAAAKTAAAASASSQLIVTPRSP